MQVDLKNVPDTNSEEIIELTDVIEVGNVVSQKQQTVSVEPENSNENSKKIDQEENFDDNDFDLGVDTDLDSLLADLDMPPQPDTNFKGHQLPMNNNDHIINSDLDSLLADINLPPPINIENTNEAHSKLNSTKVAIDDLLVDISKTSKGEALEDEQKLNIEALFDDVLNKDKHTEDKNINVNNVQEELNTEQSSNDAPNINDDRDDILVKDFNDKSQNNNSISKPEISKKSKKQASPKNEATDVSQVDSEQVDMPLSNKTSRDNDNKQDYQKLTQQLASLEKDFTVRLKEIETKHKEKLEAIQNYIKQLEEELNTLKAILTDVTNNEKNHVTEVENTSTTEQKQTILREHQFNEATLHELLNLRLEKIDLIQKSQEFTLDKLKFKVKILNESIHEFENKVHHNLEKIIASTTVKVLREEIDALINTN